MGGGGGGVDVVERELCLIIEWVTNFRDVEGRLSLTYNEWYHVSPFITTKELLDRLVSYAVQRTNFNW